MVRGDVVVDRGPAGLFGSESYAVFSPCRTWRYSLVRRFDDGPLMRVVGLNPSTADAFADDPTVARCAKRARRLGHGGLLMQNLYGLRSTDPAGLWAAADPVGPGCDEWLADPDEPVALTVAAWGNTDIRRTAARVAAVSALLGADAGGLWCLGTTADGQPRHPLYLPDAADPAPWAPPPTPTQRRP